MFGIRHFLSGVNYASESVSPIGWGHSSMDGAHVRAIHRRFGKYPLRTFPIMSLAEFMWTTRASRILTKHKPLDFINYDKNLAKDELAKLYGWVDYKTKHSESRFTKFYQETYLPKKFSFDKRRVHLSSLIVSGQLTRAEALVELDRPIVDARESASDFRFVAKKLGVSSEELELLVLADPVPHSAYHNSMMLHGGLTSIRQAFRTLAR
jgi:hypothetical protein